MTQTNNSTSSVHDEAVKYLTKQFCEIFNATEEDAKIIQSNIESMNDEALRSEMELLNTYYYNVRQAYTGGLNRLRDLAEQEEKASEAPINFNF